MDSLLLKEIQSHNSKHYQYFSTILLAHLYKDQTFYIPTFLDFRGRLYSKVSYLNYQAGDLARSLIQFYSPKENIYAYKKDNTTQHRESINYLKQSAGNVYILSKKTIRLKMEWCDQFILDMKKEFNIYLNKQLNLKEVQVLEKDRTNLANLDFCFYFLNKYLDKAE